MVKTRLFQLWQCPAGRQSSLNLWRSPVVFVENSLNLQGKWQSVCVCHRTFDQASLSLLYRRMLNAPNFLLLLRHRRINIGVIAAIYTRPSLVHCQYRPRKQLFNFGIVALLLKTLVSVHASVAAINRDR